MLLKLSRYQTGTRVCTCAPPALQKGLMSWGRNEDLCFFGSSSETNREVMRGLLTENNRKGLFSARNTQVCSSERSIQGHDKGKVTAYEHLTLFCAVQEGGKIASKECCYALKQRMNWTRYPCSSFSLVATSKYWLLFKKCVRYL